MAILPSFVVEFRKEKNDVAIFHNKMKFVNQLGHFCNDFITDQLHIFIYFKHVKNHGYKISQDYNMGHWAICIDILLVLKNILHTFRILRDVYQLWEEIEGIFICLQRV